MKPCPLCQNVFLAKLCHAGQRRPLEAAPDWAVTHCEPSKRKLVPMDKRTIMGIVKKLEDVHASSPSAADWAELQTTLGWSYDPELRARALKLRARETPVFDWMHVLFVSGVLRECKRRHNLFLEVLSIKRSVRVPFRSFRSTWAFSYKLPRVVSGLCRMRLSSRAWTYGVGRALS